MGRNIRSISAGLLFLAWPAIYAAQSAPPDTVPVGGVVHDIPLHGLNGPSRHLSDYHGKVLLINLWASWCGPCREEMGSLERLAWQEQSQRFTLLGISTDDHEEAAQRYLRAANATVNQYLDKQLQAEKMLGADRLPLTVLVGAQGQVLGKYYGARDWSSAQAVRWITQRLPAQR